MSEATVHKLKPEEGTSVPAVGVSFNLTLGGGRAMVIQTHIGQDDNVDALLDRILASADRQKAKYEIVDIEDELRRMRLMIGDQERALEKYKKAEELNGVREEGAKLQHEHSQSGRRGDFKFPANYIQRLKAVENETEKKIKGAEFEIERHKNEELRLVNEIEKRRKIVTGG